MYLPPTTLKAHQLFVLFSPIFFISASLAVSAHFLFIFRRVSEKKDANFSAGCGSLEARTFSFSFFVECCASLRFKDSSKEDPNAQTEKSTCFSLPPLALSLRYLLSLLVVRQVFNGFERHGALLTHCNESQTVPSFCCPNCFNEIGQSRALPV